VGLEEVIDICLNATFAIVKRPLMDENVELIGSLLIDSIALSFLGASVDVYHGLLRNSIRLIDNSLTKGTSKMPLRLMKQGRTWTSCSHPQTPNTITERDLAAH
jgi:hypothetical protein